MIFWVILVRIEISFDKTSVQHSKSSTKDVITTFNILNSHLSLLLETNDDVFFFWPTLITIEFQVSVPLQ